MQGRWCEGDAKEMREEMGASLYLGTLHKEREIGERPAQHDLDEEQEDEEEGSDGTRGAVDLRGRCREMPGGMRRRGRRRARRACPGRELRARDRAPTCALRLEM
jgi:hypothetical protein